MNLEILSSGQKTIAYEHGGIHGGLHGTREKLWKACLL